MKNLLIAFCILLCLNRTAQAQDCACNCTGHKAPDMLVQYASTTEMRDEAFWKLKKKHLSQTFPQEIPMIFDEWKKILGQVENPGVSGIKVYFAQSRPKELNLIFVPTKDDPVTKQHVDIPNSYMLVDHSRTLSGPTIISDIRAAAQFTIYKSEYKHDVDTDGSNPIAINETEYIFYDKIRVKELYEALNTGCLKNVVKYVSAVFLAYGAPEKLTATNANGQPETKDVSNKLMLHYRFRDCQGRPLDFETCYGYTSQPLDADTGLPCPDFCSGQTGKTKQSKH